ncbi:MAG TPA: nucleotidyl transferase AbiEii/AbiGii toxin family protein [Nakamurella sp.]
MGAAVVPLSAEQERAAVILLSAAAGQISLAGGSALIAHGLIDRQTKDLDAFTSSLGADVVGITDRVADAFRAAGYVVNDDSRSPALRRLLVTRGAQRSIGRPSRAIQIEIGSDYQALPSLPSRFGPILDPYELGANKILATYDRVRPRDADDIARLVTKLDYTRMLSVADGKMVDRLDREQLAEAFDMFTRVDDSEFPYPDNAAAVKEFMRALAESARGRTRLPALSPYGAVAAPDSHANPDAPS